MAERPLLKSKYDVTHLLSEDLISYCYLGLNVHTKQAVHIWKYKADYVSPALVKKVIPLAEKVIDIKDSRLLQMLDYAYDGKFFYTIHESFTGMVTLEQYLKDTSHWGVKALWRMSTQLLSVLIKIESRRLVCGGINLNGIYVLPSGDVKLAKVAVPLTFLTVAWDDVDVVEDCLFFPPEFIQYKQYTNRSDMYAFGVLLYLFFSRTWPYTFTLEVAQLKKYFLEGPKVFKRASDKVPDRLSDLIARCLAMDTEQRFSRFSIFVKSYKGDMAYAGVPAGSQHDTQVQRDIKAGMRESVFKRIKRRLLWLFVVCACVFGAFFSVSVYQNYLTEIPELTVPDVVGLYIEDAKDLLEENGLRSQIVGTRVHPEYPEGAVVESKPPAGRTVKQNRDIRLFLSRGSGPILVPDLVGRDRENVMRILDERGVTVEIESEAYSVQYKEGVVISQSPTPNTFVAPSSNITVVLSKGFPVELAVRKPRFSFFTDKADLRRVELSLFVLDDWEQQRIDVYYVQSGKREKLYSDVHTPGQRIQLDFELSMGGRLDVYFNDDRAFSKKITEDLVEVTEHDGEL